MTRNNPKWSKFKLPTDKKQNGAPEHPMLRGRPQNAWMNTTPLRLYNNNDDLTLNDNRTTMPTELLTINNKHSKQAQTHQHECQRKTAHQESQGHKCHAR
mmetsp:Transcript_38684/g.82575  ORF Transcript_38684/g.82575 Transcript_38684/m.82575 type:complete len:100 (+) Transcript_38684:134-433(+)